MILVPIAGKGGATIQEIQQRSGARVQVERDSGIVKISGDPNSVENAVRKSALRCTWPLFLPVPPLTLARCCAEAQWTPNPRAGLRPVQADCATKAEETLQAAG